MYMHIHVSISLFSKFKHKFQSINQNEARLLFFFEEWLKMTRNSKEVVQNDSTLESRQYQKNLIKF